MKTVLLTFRCPVADARHLERVRRELNKDARARGSKIKYSRTDILLGALRERLLLLEKF